ncbi:MAG: phage portal protein [Desulfobacteraceae bacterium]|nr:phage portal protein [Desulfobacteraceae bacterium]
MGWLTNLVEKLNPAQEEIMHDYGENQNTTITPYSVKRAYEKIEVVQRGVNLITDAAAPITFDIKNKIPGKAYVSIQPKKLNTLINFKPNPYQSSVSFKTTLILDLILEGNVFIYYDGTSLYHLPSANVEIVVDKLTYISHYIYAEKKFFPNEIIHIKDSSSRSIYRGDSRLKSSLDTINLLSTMKNYHQKFFNNNAIPGLVITTPDVLSAKIKERTINQWSQQYRPSTGGKRPMILDGGQQLGNLGHTDFRELDFAASIEKYEENILKALGIPPLLLSSGNNANINPNIRLFYISTVLPIATKIADGLEFFFGYDLKPVTGDILALKSDLKEEAQYYTSLVNNGIMTDTEARAELRLEPNTSETGELRVPANIAGSAVDPGKGGAPKKEEETKE